jgi:peptidoglycan-N-acetylglucosamine deacetylase
VVRPGSIVVLHDGGARGWRTAEALGHLLPALAARGYRVVTLSALVAQGDAAGE